MRGLAVVLVVAWTAAAAAADAPAAARPPALRDVAFDQRIGAAVPHDAAFRDHHGRAVRLGDYLGRGPVLLVPAYYRCPMLCPMVQNGVLRALRALAFDAGRDFTVVTWSFDPADRTADAAAWQRRAVDTYRRPGADAGWHAVTGEAAAIGALAEAIGFRATWDPVRREWAHAAGVVVVTPDGRVARYLLGLEVAPRDLRLALVEASAGRLGSAVDAALLFCFRWDPTTGRYTRLALGALQAGGVVTLVALGGFIGLMLRRDVRGTRP
jgi:protein SCO1/2